MELNEDLIEKLWYGEIHSANKVVLGNDKEIGDVSIQLSCLHQKITDVLDDDLFYTFNEYESCHGKYSLLLAKAAFCEGFALANKLILESHKVSSFEKTEYEIK